MKQINRASTVRFQPESRIHVALAVNDLAQSVQFYRALFAQEPTKTRLRYARFEVAEPSVNLALNEVGGPTGPNNRVAHFGIQLQSTEAVEEVQRRLTEAGVATETEENVTCCYAIQDKVWATDPDGNRWEAYVVLDDDGGQRHSTATECCSPATDCCPSPEDCCPEIPAAIVDA